MRRDKFNLCPACGKEAATYDDLEEDSEGCWIYATCDNWNCTDKKFSDSYHIDDQALKEWRRLAYPKLKESHA